MTTTKTKSPVEVDEKQLADLLAAGAHFGHQTRRRNPKMQPYIYSARNNINLIDLIQTAQKLNQAKQFVQEITSQGGVVLYVGTKRQAKSIIAQAAEQQKMPYVVERWLGGMLTNFATITERIQHMKKLIASKEDGQNESLTKKENNKIDEQISHLKHILGGIEDMKNLPQALFVVDVPREIIAITEARKLKIPVVAIVDTNADPDIVDYIIPANDDAIATISYIVNEITQSVATGRAQYEAKTAKDDKNNSEQE